MGRAEVCYNSNYGSVCDLGWDAVDARVLCSNYLSNVIGIPRDLIGKRGEFKFSGCHYGVAYNAVGILVRTCAEVL